MYLSFFLSLYIYIYIYINFIRQSVGLTVFLCLLFVFCHSIYICLIVLCLLVYFFCLSVYCSSACLSVSQCSLSLSLFLSLTHTYTHTHSLCLSSCLPPLFFTNQKNTIHFHISELRDCSIFKQLRYIYIFQNYEIIIRITRLFHF